MLHRRRISDTLKREGWDAKSQVVGTVEVHSFGGVPATQHREKLLDRVRSLGYEPTVVSEKGGRILFHTPETLAQEGEGGHGFQSS